MTELLHLTDKLVTPACTVLYPLPLSVLCFTEEENCRQALESAMIKPGTSSRDKGCTLTNWAYLPRFVGIFLFVLERINWAGWMLWKLYSILLMVYDNNSFLGEILIR